MGAVGQKNTSTRPPVIKKKVMFTDESQVFV